MDNMTMSSVEERYEEGGDMGGEKCEGCEGNFSVRG